MQNLLRFMIVCSIFARLAGMANCLMCKVAWIWIFLGLPAAALAGPITHFTNANIGREIELLRDHNNSLGLQRVVHLQSMGAFRPSSESILNLGNSGSASWLHFSYRVPGNRKLFLLVDVPNVDYIDFYTWDDNNGLVQVHTGSLRAEVAGVSVTNNYSFELPPGGSDGQIRQVFLKVRSGNIMLLPLKIIGATELSVYEKTKTGYESIYTGMLLMLLLLNLFLFINLGDRTFLYYCIYCASLLVYLVLYLRGYGYVLGTGARVVINLYPHLFASIASLAAFLFSWEFLGIKERVPAMVPWYRLMFGLWIAVMAVSIFAGKSVLALPNNYLSLISCLVALYTGWRAYKGGLGAAIYYLIAWGAVALAFVVALLGIAGIIPYHDISYQVGPIGTSIEMLFLCFAVAKRFGYLRGESQRIQGENLQLILSQNEQLERVVHERTENLSKANGDKNRLLSIVAHDLRSPFHSLRSILELSGNEMLDLGELKMLLGKSRENIDQIQLTLDNLLFWARGQMEAPGTNPEAFDLWELVENLLLVYRPLALSTMVSIEAGFSGKCQVYADRNQISLVMRNLIDNALKFTSPNAVVKISLRGSEAGVRVSVANPAEPMRIERLAQRFTAPEFIGQPGKNGGSGTGLGLHLCHGYVRSNMGELKVAVRDSSIVIYFTLPRDIAVWEKSDDAG